MPDEISLCPFCKSKGNLEEVKKHPAEDGISYTLHACRNCNNGFWTPLKMPSGDWYAEIEKRGNEVAGAGYSGLHAAHADLGPSHSHFLRANQGMHGALLDVGCANGAFIKAASENFSVWGIDFDRRAVEAARQSGLSNVSVQSLSEFIAANPSKKFDAVTFFEVLEHQDDPDSFIAGIQGLLGKGGIIAGSVPFHPRVEPFGIADSPPNHFLIFTASGLEKYLASRGFSEITVSETKSEEYFRHALGLNSDGLARAFRVSQQGTPSNSMRFRAYSAARKIGHLSKPLLNAFSAVCRSFLGPEKADKISSPSAAGKSLYFQARYR